MTTVKIKFYNFFLLKLITTNDLTYYLLNTIFVICKRPTIQFQYRYHSASMNWCINQL